MGTLHTNDKPYLTNTEFNNMNSLEKSTTMPLPEMKKDRLIIYMKRQDIILKFSYLYNCIFTYDESALDTFIENFLNKYIAIIEQKNIDALAIINALEISQIYNNRFIIYKETLKQLKPEFIDVIHNEIKTHVKTHVKDHNIFEKIFEKILIKYQEVLDLKYKNIEDTYIIFDTMYNNNEYEEIILDNILIRGEIIDEINKVFKPLFMHCINEALDEYINTDNTPLIECFTQKYISRL